MHPVHVPVCEMFLATHPAPNISGRAGSISNRARLREGNAARITRGKVTLNYVIYSNKANKLRRLDRCRIR